MSNLRFFLHPHLNKDGKQTIYFIFTILRERSFFKTKHQIFSPNWNSEGVMYVNKRSYKGDVPFDKLLSLSEVNEINNDLEIIRGKIKSIEKSFKEDGVVYTSPMVRDAFKNTHTLVKRSSDVISNNLLDFIGVYIDRHAVKRGSTSLNVYRQLKRLISDMKKPISLERIDQMFLEDFQNYLITSSKLTNSTIAKRLKSLKAVLHYAKKIGRVVNTEKLKDFETVEVIEKEIISLTQEELKGLVALELTGKLDRVRDILVFACCTGLRYSDLKALRWHHITNNEIKLRNEKTERFTTIPLIPYSKAILEKNKNTFQPLPMISDQKLNKYIKELCKENKMFSLIETTKKRGDLKIANTLPKYKLVSVHTGRKTFVTHCMEKGIPINVIMTMTGHKDYKSFARYSNITSEYKIDLMTTAWQ